LDKIEQSFHLGTDEDECLRSLFVTDPLSDREGLVTIKGHRTPGTFEWILNTNQYRDWEATQNGLLWISGPPGKGKTMMSIFLSKRLETKNPDGTVIWFFCDNKTASRNSAVNVVRGLMTQLILKHPHIMSFLLPTWKVQQDRTFHANSFETLWRIFLSMLAALENEEVYCVLDALDECDEESLSSLLFKLDTIFDPLQHCEAPKSLKLIIASREHPLSLPQTLSTFPRITLDDLDHDIELYITEKVDHLTRLKNIQGSPLQQRIESALREGAEGTFLWVSYVVQDLQKKTVDGIEAALTQLPHGLYAIYDRIVSQIKPETQAYIVEMLRWILLAVRPLKISELCDAIQVKPTEFLTQEQVCLGYVQSCGHLLQLQIYDEDREMWVACQHYDMNSVQNSQGTIVIGQLGTTFLHQSAKDFFLRQEATSIPFLLLADTQKGHTVIIERLIGLLGEHLCSRPLGTEAMLKPSKEAPLLFYAVEELAFHIRQLSEKVESLVQRNEKFFGKASKLRDYWWWHRHSSRESTNPIFPKNVSLMYIACVENLYHVVKALLQARKMITRLKHKRDINTQWGVDKETPLQMAVRSKSSRIVQLLLEHGANVSITDKLGQSSLHYAVDLFMGFDGSTYKLLSTSRTASKVYKNEAKHYERSPRMKSLLHLAATFGDYDICRELIEVWRYSIEQVDCTGRKPVHYALISGHVNLFHHMVTHWSADLEPHIGFFEAVMLLGLFRQCSLVEVFKMLIEDLGCDINATDTKGSTIFHHSHFDYKVMQVVDKLGLSVDWNKQNSEEETFIHSNPAWLHDPRLLIVYLQQSQLSINARDNRGGSPLHSFCVRPPMFRDLETFDVRMLLDFGADRHLKDNDGKTALDASISARDDEIACEDPESVKIEFFDETIKLLASYSTVVIDPRKVDLHHDSGKWLDPIDWHSSSS
jgi:ankyrin repeat protein